MGENLSQESHESVQPMGMGSEDDAMLDRIGHLTRDIHTNLAGLGLDKILDDWAQNMPDTRQRLDYVTQKTQEAAEKVLNATDVAIPLQDDFQSELKTLEDKLKQIQAKKTMKSGYDEGVSDTLAFLTSANDKSEQTKALLLEIMMAQDFQDLTGQVVKKITALAQNIEVQLVQFLLDFAPEDKTVSVAKKASANKNAAEANKEEGLLNGPQINQGADDIVNNQEQVDDLLDSLGF